jgi:uncharacterized protein (DUF427 family)
MSLTAGAGPLGAAPAGSFNFELPRRKGAIYVEPFARRMRGRVGGETVVDSIRATLLHEQGHLPVLYFPREDVRMDLLEPTDHHTRCPYKGDASYWTIRAGGQTRENAAWGYPRPLADAPDLSDLIAFYWKQLDEWLEEDEPALGHVRDPYHRIDVRETSRHVRISLDGHLLAETRRARALFEASLPTRWYIPFADVGGDVLVETDTRTTCAYKGHASYFSARVGDRLEEDVAWTYREPLHDAERVLGHVAFFDERVDVEVDGEPQTRPTTQWSPRRG